MYEINSYDVKEYYVHVTRYEMKLKVKLSLFDDIHDLTLSSDDVA